MKLVRISAFAFVALSAACASQPAPAPQTPPANVVSTTRVNAASVQASQVSEEEATPRVGKPQRSDDASTAGDDALAAPKDEPRRSEARRSWK